MNHLKIPLGVFGYNPSICDFAGSTWIAYRWHDRNDWRTNLELATLNPQFQVISSQPIKVPNAIETQSIEDPHLFVHNRDLWMSFVVSKYPTTIFSNYIAYGRLTHREGAWHINGFYRVDYGRNRSHNGMEKNWLFFSYENHLYCIYSCGQFQTILRIEGESAEDDFQSPALQWNYGTVKGGSVPVEFNGNWLRFFHSRLDTNPGSIRHRYFCGAIVMENKNPFRMLQISKWPVILGDEGCDINGIKHYKPNVVFVGGCVKRQDQFVVSYGYNDCQCRLASISEKDLNL